ncbi:hypothetical protein M407DRAFT_209628 [Tulasnella calospora MUT 4182]|uniref:Uncharacterized protein n=1 Tax=Tulasnella calospora MUT 4182 TaxID=1051891 RepID=A0A0C3QMZ3_9AGAM|nr:hypothetical protein M407DRAFT_209628 [Tulasnella calospora MUT 4182]
MTAVLNNSDSHGDDPLSKMIAPPPNETLLERDKRLRLEAEAKRISDAIDEQLRAEAQKKRKSQEVKLLLLGQSGSGKSTLQKQFQLMYAPATLDMERSSWRHVVYINLIKSIRTMLDSLEHEYDLEIDRESDLLLSPSLSASFTSLSSPTSKATKSLFPYQWDDPSSPSIPSSAKGKGKERETTPTQEEFDSGSMGRAAIAKLSTTPSVVVASTGSAHLSPAWAQQIATLRLRLAPLLSMEEVLAHKIGMGVQVGGKEEVFVRKGWQGIRTKKWSTASAASVSSSTSTATPMDQRTELVRQVASLFMNSREDVETLYAHQAVKSLIKKRKLRLEESSTFFLANLERIAVSDYMPTDDDILHARLRTMGVVEHHFEVPVNGGSKMYPWRLYDVGGARGQRPTWVPYFEDATAIIFLAPISAFDQYLEEDQRTNRVDDSLQLFTLICSNPLLKNCHLVLFLNKTDVLQKKLEAGVRVKKYITSYGGRPNDYEHVSNYFLAHFKQVHRKNNVDTKRELYTHLTSVVDTRSTRQIIVNVRDAIFRDHLKESSML